MRHESHVPLPHSGSARAQAPTIPSLSYAPVGMRRQMLFDLNKQGVIELAAEIFKGNGVAVSSTNAAGVLNSP